MKNLIFILSLVFANVLISQTVSVKNDTVYVETQSVGVLKHESESYMSVSGGSSMEKYTTLYTFAQQTPELISLVKNQLMDTYSNFEVKQRLYVNTTVNGVVAVNNDMYRAGQALRNSGNYQLMALIGGPICLINPVIGGAVILVGTIASISEKTKAGRIMMGQQ